MIALANAYTQASTYAFPWVSVLLFAGLSAGAFTAGASKDREQRHTWGAIAVVCFIALVAIHS